ncbi:MAG: hypothetical protein KDD43_07210 [Bdellovibrionales bacterium]|nr:hypothetical protein [Bdellovibrionales bacterium]
MKTTWEIHDSQIENAIEDGDQLRMLISAIVYHDSADPSGLPVYTQNIQLSISEWSRNGECHEYPATISTGSITASSNKYENEVPIPLAEGGGILVKFLIAGSGDTLIITGTSISITPIGPKVFLDYLPND